MSRWEADEELAAMYDADVERPTAAEVAEDLPVQGPRLQPVRRPDSKPGDWDYEEPF